MEDYKEKYEEAKEIMQEFVRRGSITMDFAKVIFPELAESEDEKTKKMLDIITYKMSQHQPDIFTGEENEWFNAWLEKQKEQNHWQPCIGELVELGNVIEYIESGKSGYKGGISYLKTLKEDLYKL